MALTAKKLAHILANRTTMRIGRTVQVAAVFRTEYGGQRAVAVAMVLKQGPTADPATVDQTLQQNNEYVAECPLEVDPRQMAYIALTGGALDDASIAAAWQLEVIGYLLAGLSGDRWILHLRRFR